jgi:hypothetical protein
MFFPADDPSQSVKELMDKGDKVTLLQELNREAYAVELEKNGQSDKRSTLRDIEAELIVC